MSKKELNELRKKLLAQSKMQRELVWDAKSFDKITKIRETQKKTYDKWKLLDGIMKVNEKGNKDK